MFDRIKPMLTIHDFQVPSEKQYRAVTGGTSAFLALNMLYLHVNGPNAASVLGSLTPRSVNNPAQGHAMFTVAPCFGNRLRLDD